MAKSGIIHFRSTPALDALIEAELDRLKAQNVPRVLANRSMVIRTFLAASLADEDRQEVAEAMIRSVWFILQKSMGTALPRILEELKKEAEAELREIEDAWDERPEAATAG